MSCSCQNVLGFRDLDQAYLTGNISAIGTTIVCFPQCAMHTFIWVCAEILYSTFGLYIPYCVLPEMDFWEVSVYFQAWDVQFRHQFSVFLMRFRAGLTWRSAILPEILTLRELLNLRSSLSIIERVCSMWTSKLIRPSSSR